MHDEAGAPGVVIGRIVRPHGNRGHVVVAPETDFGEARFTPETRVQGIRGADRFDLTICASRPHQGRWVVGFDGVESIDDAERLRDVELRIDDAALTALPGGQYYLHDLVGCEVIARLDGRSEAVGRVGRVETGAGPARLVVETAGGEVLVPFADEICREVDVAAKRIAITPPEGLLDLNR